MTLTVPRVAGKCGKLPAVRPYGLRDLSAYTTKRLPAPPAAVDYYSKVDPALWGMLGNDSLGDCAMAGWVHLMRAWNSEVGTTDPVPEVGATVAQYFALTGGQDSGLVLHNVLQAAASPGLFGGTSKIDAYVPVALNTVDLCAAVAFFGALYIGIAMPASAQEQFAAGQPWIVDPRSPIEGGHCVIVVGYDHRGVWIITWGALQLVTWPWLATYLDEAWVIVPQQFDEAKHGPFADLDLASLKADMPRLAA